MPYRALGLIVRITGVAVQSGCATTAQISFALKATQERAAERHLLQRKSQPRFRADGRNWSWHYPLVEMRRGQGAHPI